MEGREREKDSDATSIDRDMEVSWIPQNHLQAEKEDLQTPWQKYLDKKKDKRKMRKVQIAAENKYSSSDEVPEDPFNEEDVQDQIPKRKKKKKSQWKVEETDIKVTDLDLLVMDSDDDKSHFDFKTIIEKESKGISKKKWKKGKKENAPKIADQGFDINVTDARFAAVFSRPEFNIDPSEQNFKKTKGMEQLIAEKQKRIRTENSAEQLKPKKAKFDPQTSSSLKTVKTKWKKNAKKNTS